MFLYDSIMKPIVVHSSMEYRLAVKRNKLSMYLDGSPENHAK